MEDLLADVHMAPQVQMQMQQQPAEEKRGANVEVYGFVAWIATGLTFVAYVLWAFLSEEWLEYWATAFPTWLCISYLFFQFFFYTAFNWAFSTPLDARTTLVDEHTVAPAPDTREGTTLVEDLMRRREGYCLAEEAGRERRNIRGDVPPLCDLPVSTVNALLFPSSSSW